jgi:hypothetical protein
VKLPNRIQLELARLPRPSLADLTVLSSGLDPYRVAMSEGKAARLGEWLAETYHATLNDENRHRRIHQRGLHYRFVGRVNGPDGLPYANTNENWQLIQDAIAAARWKGLIPFSGAIIDGRNSAADILVPANAPPALTLTVGEVTIELPEELTPRYVASGRFVVQPWQQIVIGEKQILQDDLAPLCYHYAATLWLPTGEASAQGLYDLLEAAAADGRRVAIHDVSDADPAGYQMSTSIARKVQALVDGWFPDLEVRVYHAALTPDQATRWDLPDSPLKETERRGDRWTAEFGRAQTELDAALEERRADFLAVIQAHLAEHFSDDIEWQNRKARRAAEAAANEALEQVLGEDGLEQIRARAYEKLEDLKELRDQVNDALSFSPEDLGLEEEELPDQELGYCEPSITPIFDTAGDWYGETQKLKGRKSYGGAQ